MNQVLNQPRPRLIKAKKMTGKRLPTLRVAIPEKETEEKALKTGKMRQQQNLKRSVKYKKERELQARSILNLPEGV